MADKIQLRGDTAAQWTSVNPVLSAREIGIETDTDKFKFGDGVTAWVDLPYAVTEGGSGTVDSASVTAAGALMDSEVTSLAAVKNLVLPTSTTISTLGKELVGQTLRSAVRQAIGANTDRFSYKPSKDTAIFVVSTGQSNPDGIEPAAGTGGAEPVLVPFAVDSRVKMLQPTSPSAAQSATPSSGYTLVTPDPATPAITNWVVGTPNVGYYGGARGNQAAALCVDLAVQYNRPVVCLNMCLSGGQIEYWITTSTNHGVTINTSLIAFVTYMLTLPELDGVDFPDLFLWGQSESNAGGRAGFHLTPAEYRAKWTTMYDELVVGGVISPTLTRVYLTEPTQFVNETGTGGGTGGTLPYPWKWDGLREVARAYGENVTLVSSAGIPWSVAPSTNVVHFTGDGNNLYGKRIAAIDSGQLNPKTLVSTELFRDRAPRLSADLDCEGKSIVDALNVTASGAVSAASVAASGAVSAASVAASGAVTGATGDIAGLQEAGTFSAVGSPSYTGANPHYMTVTANHTYSSGTINGPVTFGGTHTLLNAAGGAGTGINIAPTIVNTVGVDTDLPIFAPFYSAVTFQSNGQALSQIVHNEYVSNLTYSCTGGGTISMVLGVSQFYSSLTVGDGATIPYRHGQRAGPSTVTGTGVLTRQSGTTSAPGTSAAHNTNLLVGGDTIPDGDWNAYQSDALTNRWNGGQIYPIKTGSGSAAVNIAKGDRTVVLVNTSTGTVTLPSAAAMTTGHTAAQMAGYELTIINNRTTNVTVVKPGDTAWGTTAGVAELILAGEHKHYVYSGTGAIWY